MIGLFLGAGFSKWAADLPLVSQLFDFQVSPFDIKENKKLELVKKLKNNWDVENPSSPPEKFIADAMLFSNKHKLLVLWYIVRRLSDPFIRIEFHSQRLRRHVLMIDEDRKYEIDGVKKSKVFLDRVRTLVSGIITTNYDLLIEYSLGTKGFNYGILGQQLLGRGAYPLSQWYNPIVLKGNIPLAKLHGSISWDESAYYTDGRRGITGKALIIAPTPAKSLPRVLEFHWNLSKKILTKSKHLIVFGFAFNSYDQAVLYLLKKAGQNIESILIIDIAPNLNAARYIWPNSQIISALAPPQGNLIINQWIRSRRI